MSLSRLSRGPRASVATLRAITGADLALDFTGPDELATSCVNWDDGRRERAVEPSAALLALEPLDSATGLRGPVPGRVA